MVRNSNHLFRIQVDCLNMNDGKITKMVLYRKERLTKLRFYVQDLVGGENQTVWKVAQSNLTDVLPSAFGLLSVLDNLVTSGPEIDSKEVGRIQGVIGLSDFHEKALVMLLNLVFTEGEYKGVHLVFWEGILWMMR
ncbi:hypothetical protein DH2020_023724 [Rehmannia glutinosa]|uniref:Dirigent protein n=1 Tax=Rehmannia glutinosa TaxID=99300 RepID=A0ABR0W6V0_REHGL